MGRRLLAYWESLPPRRQVLVGAPTLFVALLAIHLVGFPNLTFARSLAYALMEALPLTLVVTYATQVELVRRETAAAAREAGIDMESEGDDPPVAPNSGAGHGQR